MVRVANEQDVKAEEAKQLKAKAASMDQQLKNVSAGIVVVVVLQHLILESLAIAALWRWMRGRR